MKVILNQDVPNLGEEGDVCEVARGYARNFLLPKNFAVIYNKQNIAYFESRRAAIAKRKEEKRAAARSLKEKIEDLSLKVTVSCGDTGKLFGSVNNSTIAEALEKEGLHIERKRIEVPEHSIKMVGKYTIKVKLYENAFAELKIEVVGEKAKGLNEEISKESPAVEVPAEEAEETDEVVAEDDEAEESQE